MSFEKQDLVGTHYSWTENDTSVFTGQPSRRIFDRSNGNQVLFLINFYGSQSDKFTPEEGKILEQRIQDEMPLEIKSEISVLHWLRDISVTA